MHESGPWHFACMRLSIEIVPGIGVIRTKSGDRGSLCEGGAMTSCGPGNLCPLRPKNCRRALCETICYCGLVIVETGWSSEATPFYHTHWLRSSHLAARGARTARRAHAPHRRAPQCGRG